MNEECAVCGGSGYLVSSPIQIIKTVVTELDLKKEDQDLRRYKKSSSGKLYVTDEETLKRLLLEKATREKLRQDRIQQRAIDKNKRKKIKISKYKRNNNKKR